MPTLSPTTLTSGEQRLILRATAKHPRDHLIISLALGTGLRLGEIVGLNVGDVYAMSGTPRTRVCVRAEIAFSREDFVAAHRALDDASAIDPASAKILELRGRTYFLQGHETEAIASVRKSIDLDPGSSETRVLLATMLQKSGQFQEAIAIATDLIQRNPDNRRVRALLQSIKAARDGP